MRSNVRCVYGARSRLSPTLVYIDNLLGKRVPKRLQSKSLGAAPDTLPPPATDPLIGVVVDGRFRIDSLIARGGMGAVYNAEQLGLGRTIALKVMSTAAYQKREAEYAKRFLLEAATVSKLSHPNTVTVFDYGEDNGLYFIAMEFLDGVTLKERLQDGAIPWIQAFQILRQTCRSLREAHQAGLVHRDIKPGNLMLLTRDDADFVKVLDFGLVKDLGEADDDDLTETGVFMGSPKYMSPEQIQGEALDGRTDIYSLGVVLYEMLSGRPPFVRENSMQMLLDHVRAPIPALVAPRELPSIPACIEYFVLRCLAKSASERFVDMDDMLDSLIDAEAKGLATPTSDRPRQSGTQRRGERTSNPALERPSSGPPKRASAAPVDSDEPATERVLALSEVAAQKIVSEAVNDAVAQSERPQRRGFRLVVALLFLLVGVFSGMVAHQWRTQPVTLERVQTPTTNGEPRAPTLIPVQTTFARPIEPASPATTQVELQEDPRPSVQRPTHTGRRGQKLSDYRESPY